MAKEKDANKSASDDQSDQKTTPKKKGVAADYLPERQKYEMLCRGEGIKMVKWKSQLCVCVEVDVCACLYIVLERFRILLFLKFVIKIRIIDKVLQYATSLYYRCHNMLQPLVK